MRVRVPVFAAAVTLTSACGGGDGGGDGNGGFASADLGLPDGSWVAPGYENEPELIPIEDDYGIDIGDIDGDGRLDIVRWYKLSIPQGFTSETHHLLELWRQEP
jgi:hypothetical protein